MTEIAARPTPTKTTLPYRVRTVGRITGSRLHATRGTWHGDVMLTVVAGGRGRYLRRGRSLTIEGPSVGLVFPSADAGLLMADAADPYDHFYCRFAGREAERAARRVARRHGATAASPFFSTPAWQEAAEVLRRATTLPPAAATPDDRVSRLDAALAEALAVLDADAEPRGGGRLTAAALSRYIAEHVADPVDLSRAAADLGVSRAHLCRVARPALGETFHTAWTREKVAWARVLLAEPSLGVADVAARVGYRDPQYFAKVFKRYAGARPAAVRRVHSPAA